jgi:hypothetical protein
VRDNADKLDHIAEVGVATHRIVNSQRTTMLNLVASLTARIAKENPDDLAAQEAAATAQREAAASAA